MYGSGNDIGQFLCSSHEDEYMNSSFESFPAFVAPHPFGPAGVMLQNPQVAYSTSANLIQEQYKAPNPGFLGPSSFPTCQKKIYPNLFTTSGALSSFLGHSLQFNCILRTGNGLQSLNPRALPSLALWSLFLPRLTPWK